MDAWPEPENLPESLLAVPAFDTFLIPDPFRGWLEDITDRMRCPIEFPTVGAIVALSSLVGRKIGIRPKQADDWLVIPNLWGAVIGRSGIMKSPALQEAIKPLARLESEAHEKYIKEVKDFDVNAEIIKLQREDSRSKMKEAIKRGQDPKTFSSLYAMPAEALPIPKRFIVNDTTVEKLGELLNQNPNGLFVFRDELSGLLQTLDKENHENDRAFYLESWNGANSYTYDRIGRGTLFIEANCLSILGGIPPGPLSEYLRSAIKGGTGADGLMQRFQLLVYPDDPGPWKNVDRWPDMKARERAFTFSKK